MHPCTYYVDMFLTALVVLEVLQAAKVNIASMNVARPVRGSGPALCVMALDDDVPASALRQLEGMQTLSQVAKISL